MNSDIEARIRARAHAIWEEEGRPDGRSEEHWARATREVAEQDAAGAARVEAAPVEPPPAEPVASGAAAVQAEPTEETVPAAKKKPATRRSSAKKAATPTGEETAADAAPVRKPRSRKSVSA